MMLLMAGTIGVLVAVGVLHLLQRDIVRIVVGLYVIWNALNLFLVALALPAPADHGEAMTDPLIHALVLTAIIVTFGFTAVLLTLVSWLARTGDSIDVTRFREGHG